MSDNSTFNSSLRPLPEDCFNSIMSVSIFTAVFVSYILLTVPLFIVIIFLGSRRWRKRRTVSTATMTSHSDILTYNMVAMEMINVVGYGCYSCGVYGDGESVQRVGIFIFSMVTPGQTLFHLLTCVERYLAVVHPVTYLGLRRAGGVRLRNASIGCVWLLCLVSQGLLIISSYFNIIYSSMVLLVSFIIISSCSVSILRVLIRPGPGEVGGTGERVGQSKQRAFFTITAISGALSLRLLSGMASNGMFVVTNHFNCAVAWSLIWLYLPSSLVLPLLFLQRGGKLPACKLCTLKLC